MTQSTRSAPRKRLSVPRWATNTHPIFEIEIQRQRRNGGLTTVLGCFAPILFGVTGLAVMLIFVLVMPTDFFWSAESAIMTILLVTALVLLIIQLIGGAFANIMVIAQASPIISGEVELQSWRLLRTTTLTAHEIIFGKLAAILASLRPLLSGLIVIRVISTITGLIIYAYILHESTFAYFDGADYLTFAREGRWLPVLLATLAVLVFYTSQPVVQFVLS